MDFWETLQIRRSVRDFQDKPIPEEYIQKIIQAASIAPSGSNQKNWRFIVVKSQDKKDELLRAVQDKAQALAEKMNSPKAKKEFLAYGNYFTFFSKAPVVIAAVMKPYDSLTGRILQRYEANTTYISTAGIQSVSAAIENLLLAAADLGLGTCWMTGPLVAKEHLEKILNIAPPDNLLALIPVGFPKTEQKPNKFEQVDKITEVL